LELQTWSEFPRIQKKDFYGIGGIWKLPPTGGSSIFPDLSWNIYPKTKAKSYTCVLQVRPFGVVYEEEERGSRKMEAKIGPYMKMAKRLFRIGYIPPYSPGNMVEKGEWLNMDLSSLETSWHHKLVGRGGEVGSGHYGPSNIWGHEIHCGPPFSRSK
jgi:hypothetical protein